MVPPQRVSIETSTTTTPDEEAIVAEDDSRRDGARATVDQDSTNSLCYRFDWEAFIQDLDAQGQGYQR
jgi:hypothetical protein